MNNKTNRFRRKRFYKFYQIMQIDRNSRILDVGGSEKIWLSTGLEDKVTLLNIKFHKKIRPFAYVEADACYMEMFDENEYDIVYSNSVIEHVGDLDRQKMFAKEIQRVGMKYWVQTPYKHFPIEPHFLFPFFQYFPTALKNAVGINWPYSHLKKNDEDIIDELSRLRLLNKKEIQSLFQDGNLLQEKYFGLIKSLIAYRT